MEKLLFAESTKIFSLKLIDDCKFNIGYVTGDKDFFHVSEKTIQTFNIHRENIKKSLTNAKQINSNKCVGIETDNVSDYSSLFYPIAINNGEKRYIEYGEKKDIDKKYKCKVRKPWYLVPDLKVPDVVLTVFGDVPKLLVNNGEFFVSNSLLSGFLKAGDDKELVCRWYNSLTLLSIETVVHSLGGGTLVLIPGETDKLEIISNFPQDKIECTYEQISNFAKNNPTEKIYRYGDEIVLKNIYNFSDETISEVQNAISILRDWRNTSWKRYRRPALEKDSQRFRIEIKERGNVKYYYPAVFEHKKNGQGFIITIPDIRGCHTQGDDMEECMWMAHEAIGCMLEDIDEKKYPLPSQIQEIDLNNYEPGSFVTFDKEQYDRDTNLIKSAREEAGLNIKQLAELLKAPYATVVDWNNGRRKPPLWLQNLIVEKIQNSTI